MSVISPVHTVSPLSLNKDEVQSKPFIYDKEQTADLDKAIDKAVLDKVTVIASTTGLLALSIGGAFLAAKGFVKGTSLFMNLVTQVEHTIETSLFGRQAGLVTSALMTTTSASILWGINRLPIYKKLPEDVAKACVSEEQKKSLTASYINDQVEGKSALIIAGVALVGLSLFSSYLRISLYSFYNNFKANSFSTTFISDSESRDHFDHFIYETDLFRINLNDKCYSKFSDVLEDGANGLYESFKETTSCINQFTTEYFLYVSKCLESVYPLIKGERMDSSGVVDSSIELTKIIDGIPGVKVLNHTISGVSGVVPATLNYKFSINDFIQNPSNGKLMLESLLQDLRLAAPMTQISPIKLLDKIKNVFSFSIKSNIII